MDKECIVDLQNISKKFGGVQAVNDVSLKIYSGEVLALCGENGAGKSTLVKIISGINEADQGNVIFDGKNINNYSIKERQNLGISITHQEISDFPNITVAKNTFAGREPRKLFIKVDLKKMQEDTHKLIKDLEISLNENEIIGNLSVAQRQLAMIVKALSYESRLLIMDEPNSALTDTETEKLFSIIEKLKNRNIAIIFVSHRLEEVMKISEKVAVMRDGKLINVKETTSLKVENIIKLMVGRDIGHLFPPRTMAPNVKETLLDVKNINYSKRLFEISFKLFKGEILGIAGLEGSGRTETMEAIIGAIKTECKIEIEGSNYKPKSPKDAIKNNISYVPPERLTDGIIPLMTVKYNLILANLRNLKKGPMVSKKESLQLCEKYIKELKIKANDIEDNLLSLSGGNQQKVIVARSLAVSPKILILNDPTRGIDVGAKYEIYMLIQELARKGIGIIFISSELPELIGISHRIITFWEGKISGEFNEKEIADLGKDKVLNAMMGE